MSAIPTMVSSLVSMGFSRPVDVVPTASGATVFILGYVTMDGRPVPTVLRRGMTGAPSVVVQGDPLAAPSGLAISNDDLRLYIADPAGTRAMDTPDDGAIFSVSTEGGMVSVVNTGGSVHHPVAVALHGDGAELTFLARDDMGNFGVFRVGTAGGTPRRLDTGNTLRAPSGLTVANDGTVYVLDARGAGATSGTLVRVPAAGGAPEALIQRGLEMNFPAGIALSRDGARLLVSASDPGNGPGVLTWVRTDGTAPDAPMPYAPMMGLLATPSGLHRARMADVYAIADEGSGDTGSILLARP
jgi:sugar lactone lactonase YvrE